MDPREASVMLWIWRIINITNDSEKRGKKIPFVFFPCRLAINLPAMMVKKSRATHPIINQFPTVSVGSRWRRWKVWFLMTGPLVSACLFYLSPHLILSEMHLLQDLCLLIGVGWDIAVQLEIKNVKKCHLNTHWLTITNECWKKDHSQTNPSPSPPPPPLPWCADDTGRWGGPSSSGYCCRSSEPRWKYASYTFSTPLRPEQ